MKSVSVKLVMAFAAICLVRTISGESLRNSSDAAVTSVVADQGILGDNLILEPIAGKTGEAAALIFLVGAYCKQDAYVDHLKAIQEQVPFPLWVGIPHIVADLPIPVGIGMYVDSVKSDLDKKHRFKADKYFFGGHSLGGSSIGSWAHQNIEQVEGVFLWGSYVAKSVGNPADKYGAPVLTVGAELDGWMARVTRVAVSFDQMLTSSVGYDSSKYTHPVVLIPGMNHASFLSGIPPSAVQKTDLRAEITIEEAIKEVSQITAAFITVTKLGVNSQEAKEAKQTIDYMIDNVTAPMMQPILDMLQVEGAPFMSTFKNQTPWVKAGQELVAGPFMEEKTINVIDEYKTFVAVSGEFSHAKPKIQPEPSSQDNSTEILSYSHQAYNWRTTETIDAADYYAATEVGAKFKSRAAIAKYFGVDFKAEDEADCKQINLMAYEYVMGLSSIPKSAIDRFNKFGQPLEFLDDTSSSSGITWVNSAIKTKNTTESFQVSSLALLSPVDFVVPAAAGMLYCKLFSPARILEWILVDGLKKNYYWKQPTMDQEGLDAVLF